MRAAGLSYREFENSGLMLVVSEMNVRYRSAAEFDDLLTLTAQVIEVRGFASAIVIRFTEKRVDCRGRIDDCVCRSLR